MSNSINEAFGNVINAVDNVKSNLATAITAKGVKTNNADTFAKMTENVGKITITGGNNGKKYGVGDIIKEEDLEVILKEKAIKDVWENDNQKGFTKKILIDNNNNIIILADNEVWRFNSKSGLVMTQYKSNQGVNFHDINLNRYYLVVAADSGFYVRNKTTFNANATMLIDKKATAIAIHENRNVYLGCEDGAIMKFKGDYNNNFTPLWEKKYSNFPVKNIIIKEDESKIIYTTQANPSEDLNNEIIIIDTSGNKLSSEKFRNLNSVLFTDSQNNYYFVKNEQLQMRSFDSTTTKTLTEIGAVKLACISKDDNFYVINSKYELIKANKEGQIVEKCNLRGRTVTSLNAIDINNIFFGSVNKTTKNKIVQEKEYKVLK